MLLDFGIARSLDPGATLTSTGLVVGPPAPSRPRSRSPVAPTTPAPTIPAVVDALVMRLIARNPARRPADAAAVVKAATLLRTPEGPQQLELLRARAGVDGTSFLDQDVARTWLFSP